MKKIAKRKRVQTTLATPMGTLVLTAEGEVLVSIRFGGFATYSDTLLMEAEERLPSILQRTINQLGQYFQGEREVFDLELLSLATPFQKSVHREIAKIPYGKTASYKEIATVLGDGKKARAVGQAANRNQLPIVIPCHRVVGANGQLTGFAGGLDWKRYLLQLEAKEAKQPVQL